MGDADADADDTLKWLKKSKRREKELAKKRMQELENMDKQFQGDEYTESEESLFTRGTYSNYVYLHRGSRRLEGWP